MTRILTFLILSTLCFCSGQEITVLWSRAVKTGTAELATNVTGYHVGRGSTSGSYTTITDAGNEDGVRVETLPGVTNYFAVRAYDGAGLTGPWSGEATFTNGAIELLVITGVQTVTMTGTSAPPISFTPLPGYQITADLRRFVNGPVVASVRLFVEEGGTGFATMRAIGTNDVPKSVPFTVASRKAVNISPMAAVAPKRKAPVTAGSKKGKL